MLIQPIKDGFIIDHEFGADFCKAVERTNPKNEYIYMACDGQTFSMFAQSHIAAVTVNIPVEGGMHFWLGIDSVRFVSLFKRLYAGSDIVIKPTEKKVVIREDNISVKFPAVEFHQSLRLPSFELIPDAPHGARTWLVHALSSCFSALSKSKRWAGILVDNTGAVARVMKITESAIKVMAAPKLPGANRRFIVPDSMASALGSFKDSVVDLFISTNHLGVQLRNDILVYTPLLVDDYPPQYLGDLGLTDALPQMPAAPDRYVFDRESLVNALGLVSGVVGQQEPLMKCSSVGYAKSTEKPVWRISARAFNGCEAAEMVESIAGSPPQMAPLKIHAGRFLGCLKSYGETVYLYNSNDQHIVVTDDESCSDVTLMFKSS